MLALLDADIICYQVGFTTEDDPVEVAYSRVDEFISNIIIATGATDYQGYLSDSSENNFRYKIDSTYKANRVQPKPHWYNEIKEYLISKHKARIAHGMEADDALGIEQTKNLDTYYEKVCPVSGTGERHHWTILCTIDKDLGQIPGLHYSWPIYRKSEVVRKDKIFGVSEEEGLRFFYSQLLIGDKSDNIRGIDGLGEKRTAKLFDGVPTDNLFEVVKEQYENQHGELWQQELVKNSRLLWIKRADDENEETPIQVKLKAEKAGFREEVEA